MFFGKNYILARSPRPQLNSRRGTCSSFKIKHPWRSKQTLQNLRQDLAEWQSSRRAANVNRLGVAGNNPVLARGVPVAQITSRQLKGDGGSAACENLEVVKAAEDAHGVGWGAEVHVLKR